MAGFGTAKNNHHRGKFHWTAGLQFDWFGFNHITTYKYQQILWFGRIQTCETGDMYSVPSPKVSVI